MSDLEQHSDPAMPLSSLPAKALQAVYHAVTGKVESTEKVIKSNVIIREDSVRNLYQRILQELDVHHVVCEPTVTIKLTYGDDSKVTYSSWQRFEQLRVDEPKTTSSMELKFESVIRVPGTVVDQRLVIAVGLDSALPILETDRKKNEERDEFVFS